jgi:hypothetical protein
MVVLYLPNEVWGVELCCIWARVVGKLAQPKTLPQNMKLFYFSPKMRASAGCNEEKRGAFFTRETHGYALKAFFLDDFGGDF